jgi:hypothetical protein
MGGRLWLVGLDDVDIVRPLLNGNRQQGVLTVDD